MSIFAIVCPLLYTILGKIVPKQENAERLWEALREHDPPCCNLAQQKPAQRSNHPDRQQYYVYRIVVKSEFVMKNSVVECKQTEP